MRHGSIGLAAAVCLSLSVGLFAQQPAAPVPVRTAPAIPHEDISGIWNRLDTAGAGSWGGLNATFPKAQLLPEYEAKLPAEQYVGVGPAPPGWTPPAYDITQQGPEIPRCAAIGGAAGGGGGGRGGRGGSGPIMPDSLGTSIMASNDVVLFLSDGAQGATRRVLLDGRKFQDPSRVAGPQSYGYWDNGVLTIKSKGFGSGVVQYGRGWTEPTTEMTETLKLTDGGKRLVWTYTYEDPKVYIKPHTVSVTYERLPADQYIFESWCDTKLWMEDQAKQAAAGRGAAAGAAPPAGRGANPAAGGR